MLVKPLSFLTRILAAKALVDNSPLSEPRKIDGIVLTKYDTVDNKVRGGLLEASAQLIVFFAISFQVGASVSMVYKTGQPVMFVGTGQKYNNLKKMNVQHVIKALFN